MNSNNLPIDNVQTSLAYCEAKGLSACFEAYANEAAGDEIMAVGFNPSSGYTYIALESGLTICSMLGRPVEYLITDYETGEEQFFDSYEEATNKL